MIKVGDCVIVKSVPWDNGISYPLDRPVKAKVTRVGKNLEIVARGPVNVLNFDGTLNCEVPDKRIGWWVRRTDVETLSAAYHFWEGEA